jgi:hypothetical protein
LKRPPARNQIKKVIPMRKDIIKHPDSHPSPTFWGRLGRVGTIGESRGKKGRIGVTIPPNGFIKDIEACGIAGLININGKRETGSRAVDMITTLTDRENGLGAGFACYGLFPDMADFYCI